MFTSLSISFKMDSLGNSPPSNEDSSNESIPQVPQVDDEILFEFFPSENSNRSSSPDVIEETCETFLGFNSSPSEGFRLPKEGEIKTIGFLDLGTAFDGYISLVL